MKLAASLHLAPVVQNYWIYYSALPTPVAAKSKAWVCGRSLARFAGSNPAGNMDVTRYDGCCQVEVFETGRSLFQRSRTGCGEFECDPEGFSWFPCVYKRMLRWFPSFQVATTCLLCSLPDLNFLVTFFHVCVHLK